MAFTAPRTGLVRKIVAPSWVQSEALNVAPDLVGVPLAPHARRAWAMVVDLAVIALLSGTGSFWIAAGIAALAFQLRGRRRDGRGRNAWLWLAIALLVFVAAQRVTRFVERRLDPGTVATAGPSAAGEAEDDDDDDDGRLATAAARVAAPASPASATTAVAAMAAMAATAQPGVTAEALRDAQQRQRILALERELAQAREPWSVRWRDDLLRAVHRIGLGFGWAIAYFTLLPVWWKGQTVGKKLFGLRVVQLTGAPLGVVACFGRYGGYAAGMATGATGFLQVLWDANRQAIQDKIAHTVVVDLRAARVALVPDGALALSNASTGAGPAAPTLDAPHEGAA